MLSSHVDHRHEIGISQADDGHCRETWISPLLVFLSEEDCHHHHHRYHAITNRQEVFLHRLSFSVFHDEVALSGHRL